MSFVFMRKNNNGIKMDEAMENLENRRRRFYGDDVADNSYVVALSSMAGAFSTAFFEVKDANDMYRIIYDVMKEVRGSSYMNLNRKHSFVERLYAPNDRTTTALILDDYDLFPRINFGTGAQFKFSRQNGVISGESSLMAC